MTKKWTRETIIAAIQEAAKETGYASSSDLPLVLHPAKETFGSWVQACEAAGVVSAGSAQGYKENRREFYEPKRDCMLYLNDHECKGLKELYCKKEGKCNFYKLED